jgi:anion-transporting  ArsA/GET3 family ATPase
VLPKEQSSWGGSGGEEIMLNIDTFKNMCMLVKTEEAKKIRKYYVKLENIYNKIVKEEQQKQLEEKEQLHQIELEEKDKLIEHKQKELEFTQQQLQTVNKLQINKIYNKEKKDVVYA